MTHDKLETNPINMDCEGAIDKKVSVLTLEVPMVTNINFLLTISIICQETRLWELKKWSTMRTSLDLLSNSLNTFFMEMYRDQFGEFVCGYWGLKG